MQFMQQITSETGIQVAPVCPVLLPTAVLLQPASGVASAFQFLPGLGRLSLEEPEVG